MTKKILGVAALAGVLGLAACSSNTTTTQPVDTDATAAAGTAFTPVAGEMYTVSAPANFVEANVGGSTPTPIQATFTVTNLSNGLLQATAGTCDVTYSNETGTLVIIPNVPVASGSTSKTIYGQISDTNKIVMAQVSCNGALATVITNYKVGTTTYKASQQFGA